MRNSEKRKVKRSFPRPKASAILGLETDGPLSMHNTISTNGNRIELLVGNGKEVNNLISSIENSSVELNQMNPKLDKAEFLIRVTEEIKSGMDGSPELAHPPQ